MTLNDPFEKISKKSSKYMIQREIANGYRPDLKLIDNEIISGLLENCWCQDPNKRLTFDEIFDFITKEEFYSCFEPLDHNLVTKYLEEYGNEFDEIKKRFE